MKNKIALILTLTMMVSATLTGCGGNSAATEINSIELKIGVSTGEDDPRNIAAQSFADEIKKETNGRITAVVYPAGQLGGDAEMISAISTKSKKIDMVISDASNFFGYEPMMGISAQPFLFSDFDMAWKFMDSDIEAEAEKSLSKSNMHVLAHYCNGFRCITNSVKTINSPEDMKGLIIRTPENPVIMETMTSLGANPQALSFSELYPALRNGTYDGQENPIPVIYNNKLYEVQKYLSVTNHIYSGMCFVISEDIYKRLSNGDREIIEKAAQNSAELDRNLNREQTESLLSELEKQGIIVTEPELAPFKDATKRVLERNKNTYGALYDKLNDWLEKNGN